MSSLALIAALAAAVALASCGRKGGLDLPPGAAAVPAANASAEDAPAPPPPPPGPKRSLPIDVLLN